MDLLQLLRAAEESKGITQLLRFVFPAFLGALIEILIMKVQGKSVSFALGALMMTAGCTSAYFVGDYLDYKQFPNSIIHPVTFMAGMVGHSVMFWLHARFNRGNIGETMKALIEWLLKK